MKSFSDEYGKSRCAPCLSERIVASIAAACNRDKSMISPDASLIDVGMDSIGVYVLVADIEANYDCEFTARQILNVMTSSLVSDVVTIVRQAIERSHSEEGTTKPDI
jgi:acyl carrier protein